MSSSSPPTSAVSIDPTQTLFRNEYELELETWLRRRFRAVCIWYMVLGVAIFVAQGLLLTLRPSEAPIRAFIITPLAAITSLGVIAYYLFGRPWAEATREQLLRAASTMILLLGAISFVKNAVLLRAHPESTDFILPLFFWHFVACLFLPWTPRESLRPILPLLAAWALGVLVLELDDLSPRLTKIIFAPLILVPGLGICAIRLKYHSESFRSRMVGKHFHSMRQEFAKARNIHESMFPRQHDDGFVRFEYTYAPMRELGGDYVHLHVGAEGLVHLTLLDVTGHGLAAALTVNRLYGELERIRGESPHAEPGEVLTLLNRYVNLTLVKHNIYVTALCITLDPYLGRLMWANAGHPPAFLRGANGVVTPLPASEALLGALDGSEFAIDERSIELSPGDVIVVYTDGVYEARNRAGRALGLSALREMVHSQPPPRNWPQFIASAVGKHHAGRAEDDVLVASLMYKTQRPQSAQTRRTVAAS